MSNSNSNSNSPEVSPLSSPDIRSDDIIFSTRPSPSAMGDQYPLGGSVRPREAQLRPGGTHTPPRSIAVNDSPLARSPRTPVSSKPIAIELPPTKVNSAPVYTPPAPLSARGDIPGGYFPFHEDQNRVYRPHPFQLDASKARMKSIERANRASSPESQGTVGFPAPPTGSIPATIVTKPSPVPMADQSTQRPDLDTTTHSNSSSKSRSNTPVALYMPTGAQDSPLPMGKYYPTNYEQRKDEKRKMQSIRPLQAESSNSAGSGSRSDTQVPTVRDPSTIGHSRNESEARRRLQQYQRDMIAQATLALNGGNVNQAALNSLKTMGFTSMAKPSKPKLEPLGSPGPVTPMELGGSDADGYLGARGAADAQTQEIARAIRAEEEMKRREGTSSPAIELGPSTF
ncbi:hypothetical protein F4778DRAFT_779674 [Xylariomycetidae sp. FL2044]|nr:hypothetical protein F4778DRAFT_779674 [Xylariomycetidae sp. FL2044]